MRKFIVLPLLVLLAACTDMGPIAPDGPDGPAFAKLDKCTPWPTCRGGDGDGDGSSYLVQDLGTLGGSFSAATDINDNGDIVGRSLDADGKIMATLWAAPVEGTEYLLPTQVGDPTGYTGSYAHGINQSSDAIVGEATPDPLTSEPVRWTSSNGGWEMEPLALPGGAQNGIAYDVNNDKTAVGWTRVTGYPAAATFWPATATGEAGEAHLLPVKATDRSIAYGINDAGHIVGSGGAQAVLWMPSSPAGETYQRCDMNHGDALTSSADAVSEVSGNEIKILGLRSYGGGDYTIAVWTLAVSDPPNGCPASTPFEDIAGSGYHAWDINSDGVVVAQVLTGQPNPVLWTAAGKLVELPVLKGKRGAAQAISNAGLVVGWGAVDKQESHAMLWKEKTPN